MRVKDLILFIHENDVEWHWNTFYEYGDQSNEDAVIFVNDYQLEAFRKVLHSSDYEDDGLEIILKDNYFCIRMSALCENNDIDIYDVFDMNKKD